MCGAANETLSGAPLLKTTQRPKPGATAAEWKVFAKSLLPSDGCVFRQNQRITALYAEVYLDNPDCFKWAGMAAYASHHVRLALLPLRLNTDQAGCRESESAKRKHKRLKSKDIELVRSTNNGIFADIFWAHLVYGGSSQGFAELSRLMDDDDPMLKGFALIEQGRAAIEGGSREEGEALVWQGNKELLRHEQESMVQPRFEKLSGPFALAFSAASTLNFSAGGPMEHVRLFCSFYYYMMSGGVMGRSRPPLLPSITHLPDRWSWIEHCILPKFQRFESSETSPINTQLQGFIRQADSD